MPTFLEKCEEYFDTRDFYQVLNISPNATDKDIKKAYHKLSLQVHPDRVEDDEKHVATEKFKVLGRIHSILHDAEKRKIYDETGDFDDETDDSFDWLRYWRDFKTISLQDIQDYERKYKGSETEVYDIKKAYVGSKGDMNKILLMVPFSGCEDEPRFIEIVQKMVDAGEVESYDKFFNEPKSRKNRRKRKFDAEKQEAAKIDMEEFEKEIRSRREQQAQGFMDLIKGIEDKYGKRKQKKAIASDTPTKKRTTRSSKK